MKATAQARAPAGRRRTEVILTAQLVSDTGHDAPPPPAAHPLDPLSAAEISAAAAIVRSQPGLPPATRFVMITLAEPPKPPGLDFARVPVIDRVALVITYDAAASLIHESLVSLTAGTLLSATPVPDRFPSLITDEMSAVEELVRQDPRWQAAMRERGVTDFHLAMIDPWPSGYLGPADHPATSSRLCRPLTWMRSAPGEHGYARPVEGLIVTVDMDNMTVLDVADHGVVPLPAHPGNYAPEFMFDPENRPAFTALRDDVQAHRDHPARGSQLHGRRLVGELAEVAAAGRLQPARGPGRCTRSATPTGAGCARCSTGPRCRRWWCPTATPRRPTGTRTCSTWARSAWASWPTR